ncbi:hypothetical protein SAY87_023072 [Trapa incisa]|uniref:Uncharacterized protein n=1 Tax=Trapa incisa TaxID=236973 RepID=A0AAN7K4T3_9MYRT|nr:hypothetical protein SAY87_023072 [Trapa incisa]
MSASTVSITANPASVRRRPVLVTDKKPTASINLFAVENGPNGAVGDDRVASGNSKDLSHLYIGCNVKDITTVKKDRGQPYGFCSQCSKRTSEI